MNHINPIAIQTIAATVSPFELSRSSLDREHGLDVEDRLADCLSSKMVGNSDAYDEKNVELFVGGGGLGGSVQPTYPRFCSELTKHFRTVCGAEHPINVFAAGLRKYPFHNRDAVLVVLSTLVMLYMWSLCNNISRDAFESLIPILQLLNPEMAKMNVGSLYTIKKLIGVLTLKTYETMIMCPDCGELIPERDIFTKSKGKGWTVTRTICTAIRPTIGGKRKARKKPEPCGYALIIVTNASGPAPERISSVTAPCTLSICDLREGIARIAHSTRARFLMHAHTTRAKPEHGVLWEIWDGSMWKRFLSHNNVLFLDSTEILGLGLGLCVDWVKPNDYSRRDMLCTFLCILNLPREERYKMENSILLAVSDGGCGGPKIPLRGLLHYLTVVLTSLWNEGMSFETDRPGHWCRVRAALLLIMADEQAGTKVCSCTGHNSRRSCWLCMQRFLTRRELADLLHVDWHTLEKPKPTVKNKLSAGKDTVAASDAMNASSACAAGKTTGAAAAAGRVDVPEAKQPSTKHVLGQNMTWGGWAIEGELEKGALLTTMLDELPKRNYPEGDSVFPKRSAQDELEFSAAFKAATASNERKKLSSDNGVRHSPLHALPYVQDGTCQLSQMVAVDLLHAGFLGVCKTTLNNLVYMGLIPADGLVRMQTVLDSLPIPYSIGQVPGKIQCGFSCLKGAEQMNLWLYFLPNLCRDLHPKVFKLVLCLSTALRMVSATSVSEQSLTYAHRLFILFNIRYERMFGAYACTFNMHALVHLRECALRLGPPRTHWGFPCERYYGFLTKIKNNITGVSKSIFQRSARSALTIHYEGLTGSEFPDEARTVHDGLCKTVGLYTTGHSRIAEQPARGYHGRKYSIRYLAPNLVRYVTRYILRYNGT